MCQVNKKCIFNNKKGCISLSVCYIIPMEKITANDVLHWHGSDHDIKELAQVVADIVNGDYAINNAKEEIEMLKD